MTAAIEVFNQPAEFKSGFSLGLYLSSRNVMELDSRLDEILRLGIRDEADEQFLSGFHAGRNERDRHWQEQYWTMDSAGPEWEGVGLS